MCQENPFFLSPTPKRDLVLAVLFSRFGGVAIVGNVGARSVTWRRPSLPQREAFFRHLHHLRHDKMSDRDTLLSMGFDSARVDCKCIDPLSPS